MLGSDVFGARSLRESIGRTGVSVMSTIHEVKRQREAELLDLPNVVGVGIGPELSAGEPTERMAIKVYVRKKVPERELPAEAVIPPELDGYPTDVEEQAPLRAV